MNKMILAIAGVVVVGAGVLTTTILFTVEQTAQACHFDAPGFPSSGQRVSSAAITDALSTCAWSAS